MDDKELAELATRTATRLFGAAEKSAGAFGLWEEFDPELAQHVYSFITGRMYSREVLSQKQRELCAVAALAARDAQPELYQHCVAALNLGATREEVAEVLFQVSIYAGVPCMVHGLRTFKSVLQDRREWQDKK
jgi:alkylhydroperoxidase/carboxymuconolactone decarboxylase family protein YurZ